MTEVVSGINSVLASVTTQLSIANIATIIGIILGGVVGLYLFWWGTRKVVSMIQGGFKKGRLKI